MDLHFVLFCVLFGCLLVPDYPIPHICLGWSGWSSWEEELVKAVSEFHLVLSNYVFISSLDVFAPFYANSRNWFREEDQPRRSAVS